ncbi:MAG: hypothetical protein DI551_12170 [Micavibrio aeruginosavorus]|uniref:Uncharacterized protein n=1 Tax=Micavibrio aeruginosavorus TaxID=349221 RepID=A0A2W5MQ15_9BACT|nr:MAG: hypothetical protein DI551_12170 [Micavibrio aeruginosavorus]
MSKPTLPEIFYESGVHIVCKSALERIEHVHPGAKDIIFKEALRRVEQGSKRFLPHVIYKDAAPMPKRGIMYRLERLFNEYAREKQLPFADKLQFRRTREALRDFTKLDRTTLKALTENNVLDENRDTQARHHAACLRGAVWDFLRDHPATMDKIHFTVKERESLTVKLVQNNNTSYPPSDYRSAEM